MPYTTKDRTKNTSYCSLCPHCGKEWTYYSKIVEKAYKNGCPDYVKKEPEPVKPEIDTSLENNPDFLEI